MAHDQLSLFGDDVGAVQPIEPDPELAQLRAALPDGLRMGTSSWSFPGWAGLVYAPRTRPLSESLLARDGLAAYARHPLLRTVGIDRTFYAPVSTDVHAQYAAATPPEFRFLVKAPQELVSPHGRDGRPHERFLDVKAALEQFVAPARDGLAGRLGVLLYQFPPLPTALLTSIRRAAPGSRGMLESLHRLLRASVDAVPSEVVVAVELRNREFFDPRMIDRHRDGLAASGAVHCYNVHPSVPELDAQCEAFDPSSQREIVIRWMLRRNHRYEEAAEAYRPFDRLVEPDPATRSTLAALALHAEALRRPTWIIVNNKAEGSSPLTILELARETVARRRARGAGLDPRQP